MERWGRRGRLPCAILSGKTMGATIAAPVQRLEAFYGAEPPASLQSIFLPSIQAGALQSLTRLALLALGDAKVPYSLAAGTLLGWARLQTLLPWDDDVDLCIPKENLADLQNIDWGSRGQGAQSHGDPTVPSAEGKVWCGASEGLNFLRGDLPGLWKIVFADRVPGDCVLIKHLNGRVVSGACKAWRWPFVDVFLMQIDSKTQRHYVGKSKQLWPGEAMDAAFTTRSADLQLGNATVHVQVPRCHARYLDDAYGADWRTRARLPDFDHRQDRMVFRSDKCKAAEYIVSPDWPLKQGEIPCRGDLGSGDLIGVWPKGWEQGGWGNQSGEGQKRRRPEQRTKSCACGCVRRSKRCNGAGSRRKLLPVH